MTTPNTTGPSAEAMAFAREVSSTIIGLSNDTERKVGAAYDPADFARSLERELAELKEYEQGATSAFCADRNAWRDKANQFERELHALEKSIMDLSHPNMKMIIAERDELKKQNEADGENIVRLRTALNRIAYPSTYGTRDVDPLEIARRALLLGIMVDPLPTSAYDPMRQQLAAAKLAVNALEECDKAFADWQAGQIPGRPEDIYALIGVVRGVIAQCKDAGLTP